ncbi:MAG TPA: DUF5777 family beta-barrel protein [Vicinamibacterales bacterium]|nr:DUF5777 family beta-barrel protein [Vicinamibacterales bacterium]
MQGPSVAFPDSDVTTEAQSAPGDAAPSQAPEQTASREDPAVLQPAEPDFRITNLPTTMRLPRNKLSFDLTHRFGGNLTQKSFQENVESLFGLDDGAAVGLELRYGVTDNIQAGIYRTNLDRTIQFYGRWDALRQASGLPVSASLFLGVEGTDNFSDDKTPELGAVISRKIDEHAALYAEPIWIHNVAPRLGETRDTFLFGMGGRVRVLSTVYVTAEVSPRVAGYNPLGAAYAFGIEKRAGGHMFQLNFGNTAQSTLAQIARGARSDSLFMGFNLTRKFF